MNRFWPAISLKPRDVKHNHWLILQSDLSEGLRCVGCGSEHSSIAEQLMMGQPIMLETTAFCCYCGFCWELRWMRRCFTTSSPILTRVVRTGESDIRDWGNFISCPMVGCPHPKSQNPEQHSGGIAQVACLIAETIKMSVLVRYEVTVTQWEFPITFPPLSMMTYIKKHLHQELPSNYWVILPEQARVWYLQNCCALCCGIV